MGGKEDEDWATVTTLVHALCGSCLRLLLKRENVFFYLFHELHDDLINFKDLWYY